MGTPRDLKVQMAGETRARERALALAARETSRADRAETALTAMTAERDHWKARALAAEAKPETDAPADGSVGSAVPSLT